MKRQSLGMALNATKHAYLQLRRLRKDRRDAGTLLRKAEVILEVLFNYSPFTE